MAQEQNSTNTTSKSSNHNNSKPNWKQRNAHSQKPKQQNTASTHNKGGQKQTRNEKRRRWAKKHKVSPKPVIKRGPVKEYISTCCKAPATKPAAGDKVVVRNPETGKPEKTSLGLGHWRCSTCTKAAKVTPRKPEVKEVPSAVQTTSSGS